MNETLQSIYGRWSCRAFTGELPPAEDLLAVARAALAAPSAMNRQPWHVILVKDRALIAAMEADGLARIQADPDQTTWERLKGRGGTLFYHAPCLLTVACAASPFDCGIVTQTAALAAASLGVASCICGLAGQAFSGARGEEFKRRLGFPPGYDHGMTVLLGYAQAPGAAHPVDAGKLSVVE